MDSFGTTVRNGFWRDNPGLTQLLGLCPLLAVSDTLIHGLTLGLATLLVLAVTSLAVSLTRGWIDAGVRLPTYVLIIASQVTLVELAMQAWFFELHLALGIFVPLIATNCIILARAETFASRQPVLSSLADAIGHGAGFAAVLIVLGTVREILGYGTWLRGAEQLFGGGGAIFHLFDNDQGFLLILLPPGAFISLGLLLAGRNWLAGRNTLEATERA